MTDTVAGIGYNEDFTSSNNDVFPVLLLFANRVQKSPKCGFD